MWEGRCYVNRRKYSTCCRCAVSCTTGANLTFSPGKHCASRASDKGVNAPKRG